METGKLIKELRIQKDMTQEELAFKLKLVIEQCRMKSKQKHLSAGFPAEGMAGRFNAGITAYKTIAI